jgi:hypothetical protein
MPPGHVATTSINHHEGARRPLTGSKSGSTSAKLLPWTAVTLEQGLSRCPLEGTMGDALFAVLCAGGHNIRKILAHLGALFEWIIAAIVLALCAPFRAAGHVSLRDIDPA